MAVAIWGPPPLELLGLSLAYVLTIWTVAGAITLWMYVAFSLAPFSDLLMASLRASSTAMWLLPGLLLMASRSPLAVSLGLAIVINCARLLAASRAPKVRTLPAPRPAVRGSEPLLFRYQAMQAGYFSWEIVPTIFGALALQVAVYWLAGGYPLPAAASFAAVTVIWAAMSVARGGMEPRTGLRKPRLAPGMILTLLFTVTLTAVLIQTEVGQDAPPQDAIAAEFLKKPGITQRLLQRLAHLPPVPPAPAKVESSPATVVTGIVDPTPATREKGGSGVPGAVLRPRPKRAQRPVLIAPGAHPRISTAESLAIPFTGEYHLFRTSSGGLPSGAIVESGTPLDRVYGTTNGGSMETVAVQTFDPPIDMTQCGTVLVVLTSAEVVPLLASIQFVADGRVENGSTELTGIKQAREETLEFQVPVVTEPLVVQTIRIAFHRLDKGSDKNVRVAVERFTLVPRRRWP